MPILKEYFNELDRELDKVCLGFEIQLESAFNDYTYETAILAASNGLIVEAEDSGSKNAFLAFIEKIIKAVSDFTKSFINMLNNAFSSKDHLDIDAYLKSSTGTMELEYDMAKVQEKVDAEIRKGRKIIQLISKGTGIDDATVEKFVDSCTGFLGNHKKAILSTSAILVIYHGMKKKTTDNQSIINGAADDAKAVAGNPTKEKLVKRVLGAMTSAFNESVRVAGTFTTQLEKEAKKQK